MEAHNVRASYQQEPKDNSQNDQKYHALQEKSREQEKIIQFQKAKIAALQSELDETIKQMSKSENSSSDLEKHSLKLTEENKKLTDKLAQQAKDSLKLK